MSFQIDNAYNPKYKKVKVTLFSSAVKIRRRNTQNATCSSKTFFTRRESHYPFTVLNKQSTMAPKLSIRKYRWCITPSFKAGPMNVERTEPNGLSVSQEETASDSSSYPLMVNTLDDFALPMWDNPVNASEYAVVKNANHVIKASSSQLLREVQTFPKPTRPQSTPENMLIVFGNESSNDEDLTINEMDFMNSSRKCAGPRYHDAPPRGSMDDRALDFNAAKSLQEEEIFRLALKMSLYDA